jgi:intracellular septation protein A
MTLITSLTIIFQSSILMYICYVFHKHIEKKREIEDYCKMFNCMTLTSNNEQHIHNSYKNLEILMVANLIQNYVFREHILFGKKIYVYLCHDLRYSQFKELTDEELLRLERYEELAERKKRRGY